jgi:enoyl-CoA hydratase/carnithine racemase
MTSTVASETAAPVTVSIDGGVAQVRLNRPDKLNALTLDTLDALVSVAHDLADDKTLRGVVLGGAGRSFCAGLDFASVFRTPSRIATAFAPRPWRGTNTFQEACWAWRRIPVPVVAAVQGHCLGGGLQIAMGADFRFTTADAQWAVLEAKWGLIPDMSGIQALSQQVGMDVAKRLTMTGEVISGERAVALGLATEVVDDPYAAAAELIEAIATRSPDSVAATKRIFNRTWTAGDRRTFFHERLEQAWLLAAANTRIAREAAMTKVPAAYRPRWR